MLIYLRMDSNESFLKMKLHNVQYMRAIAALLIVYVHARHQVGSYAGYLEDFGNIGVDLFFVISGFIMVWIAKDSDTPFSFISKRIERIAPLYWSATLLIASIVFLFPELFKTAAFSIGHLVKSLLFIPHYSPGQIDKVGPLLHPGWTLNYEMYFYSVFALSLFTPKRFRLATIFGTIFILFCVSKFWSFQELAILTFWGNSIVFEFVVGALFGTLYKSGTRLNKTASILFMLGSALSYFALSGLPRGISNGVPAMLFFVGFLNLKLPSAGWANKLGDSSYSLYLSHLFVMGGCRTLLPTYLGDGRFAAISFVFISASLSILVGLFVYSYVETGLLKWRPKIFMLKSSIPKKIAPTAG